MKMNPYLNFDGNCKEAFEFYKNVFGGEFDSVLTFGDMPEGEQQMPDDEKDRIMHISLSIDKDLNLMGSDISPSMGYKLNTGNNIYISLHPETKEEGQKLFDELSYGGKLR